MIGKTTTLQNLLTNNEGLKIGIIVNDFASINIDAKLLNTNPFGSDDNNSQMVKLQNGCACCSLADELMTSVNNLLESGLDFDAIVVELSGVADPKSVRRNWNEAELVRNICVMHEMSIYYFFCHQWHSASFLNWISPIDAIHEIKIQRNHPTTQLAKLEKVVTLVDSTNFGTNWMTWDTTKDRDWLDKDGVSHQMVSELLAEQVESADILLINKIDIANKDEIQVTTSMARSLNENAVLHEVEFGAISVTEVLGLKTAAEVQSLEHHDHDSSHSHEHSHEHNKHKESEINSTNHSHSYDHDKQEHNDTDHSHTHSHKHEECNDTGHSHTHSHSHSTHTENMGITNFVYKSGRPFNAHRLIATLNQWPIPQKEYLDLDYISESVKEQSPTNDDTSEKSPFLGVLRSKGFCWLAPTNWHGNQSDSWRHDTVMYWSHAGRHFGMNTAGRWWGTIRKSKMKQYFAGNMDEYDRIMREEWTSKEFGDRRQEIVFIGAGISEREITDALESCLCTDDEFEDYRKNLRETNEMMRMNTGSF